MIRRSFRTISTWLLVVLCLGACVASDPHTPPVTHTPAAADGVGADLVKILPGEGDIPGWSPDEEPAIYDEETLFDLVNGQADAFYAYNFQQVVVQRYTNDNNDLRVEIWELATPADAYGLFTRSAAGIAPATVVGNDADTDPGRRLAFWQDRYFVQVRTLKTASESDIETAAGAIARALPAGGERPSLMHMLPAEGRSDRGAIFFRREISIQDEIWLGGENVLQLGPETAGALGHYDIAGTPVLLILVTYPSAGEAELAQRHLHESGIAELAGSKVSGTVLAALFGTIDAQTAEAWLAGVTREP